jgi:hypothetical protein
MSTMFTNDIFRIIIFVLSWVNSYLVAHGHKPIPVIDQSQVSWGITFVVSVWAMLKESPFKTFLTKKEVAIETAVETAVTNAEPTIVKVEDTVAKVEATVNTVTQEIPTLPTSAPIVTPIAPVSGEGENK